MKLDERLFEENGKKRGPYKKDDTESKYEKVMSALDRTSEWFIKPNGRKGLETLTAYPNLKVENGYYFSTTNPELLKKGKAILDEYNLAYTEKDGKVLWSFKDEDLDIIDTSKLGVKAKELFKEEHNPMDPRYFSEYNEIRFIKNFLSNLITDNRIRALRDDEKLPRGFRFKGGSGNSGEVTYKGKDYAYALVNGKVRVMPSSEAGWNWSETIYKMDEDLYSAPGIDNSEMSFDIKDDGTIVIYDDGKEIKRSKTNPEYARKVLKDLGFKEKESIKESFKEDIEKCKFEITIIPNENEDLDVFNKLTHHMDYLVDVNESGYTFWDVNVDITEDLIKVTGIVEGHECQYLEDYISIGDWPEIDSIEVDVYKEDIKESFEDEHLGSTERTVDDAGKIIPDSVNPGPDAGLATELNKLIRDEWEAIQGYNDAIVMAELEGFHDVAKVFKDIVNEENVHVGQLEQCMKLVSPNTDSISQGETEATDQLTEAVDKKQAWLKEMAQDDWDAGHTFDLDDFHEFKKIAKECGFNVNEKDFDKYFEYLEDIRYEANNEEY